MNHLGGGDETEKIPARKVNPENRNEFICDKIEIEACTKFTFPDRAWKYSAFHFKDELKAFGLKKMAAKPSRDLCRACGIRF